MNGLKGGIMILLLFLAIQGAGATSCSIRPNIKTYIADHLVMAKILSKTYGIPTSIILGVAIVESSAGTCDVARVLNNHFGIVGRNEYINRNGNKSRYKQYSNVLESYIDFCVYISHKKFYHKIKNKKDPRLWVQAMSDMGYSEEPETWRGKILHTILVNHLK